jgi:carbonic anhydrase
MVAIASIKSTYLVKSCLARARSYREASSAGGDMSKRLILMTLAVHALGCAADDDGSPSDDGMNDHWTYDGEHGPEHWGELPGNEACSNGELESPIALESGEEAEDLPDLELEYEQSGVSIHNSGHSLQWDYDPGSSLRIGDDEYELVQFHFHAPSEHTLDGRRYPMEAHLVHRSADDQLAVLGAFIEEGARNEMLEDARWSAMPELAESSYEDEDALFNASELVPGGATYRYHGSLTTPPCTEGIAWHVFEAPIAMSAEQIERFTELYMNNSRPVQPVDPSMFAFGQ